MKLFKDIPVGQPFVLHNGQQLVKVESQTFNSHNCLDYPWFRKRFMIEDETECLSVDELMSLAEPLTMENSEEVNPIDVMSIMQKHVAKEFEDTALNAFDKFDWAAVMAEDNRKKAEAIARNEWIVETKIADEGRSVEVSAVIKGSHGEKSWGWHDDGKTKHVVLRVADNYQKTPVLRSIIELAEDEARRICRIKN